MAKIFDPDDFDSPPPPPRFLYKYLSAERVGNVLEDGTVRFTPLMKTNDTFEVRSTSENLAGPNFIAMLTEQMDTTVSEAIVREIPNSRASMSLMSLLIASLRSQWSPATTK